MEFFKEYQDRVSAMIGPVETKQLVNGALVLIVLGGNDFVNNYFFTPYSARRLQYSLPEYSSFLISEYSKILTVIWMFSFSCLESTKLIHRVDINNLLHFL